MKLTKTLISAATVAVLAASAANALTVAQCTSLGGSVDLASGSCQLTAAQLEQAAAQGLVEGTTVSAGGAGLGTVGGVGAGAAAAGGLLLAAVLIGDGSSGTTTTTTGAD